MRAVIRNARAGAFLQRRAKVGGGGFGGARVDETPGAPLKASNLREARNDLDMPVIVVVCWHVKGLRMKKVIIGDMPDRTFDTTDQVTCKPRNFVKLASLRIFKSRPNSKFRSKSTVAMFVKPAKTKRSAITESTARKTGRR